MDLSEFLRILRRNWLILAAFLLAGLLIATVVSLLQPKQYQAKADLFVTTASTTTLQDLSNATAFTQQVVKSYVSVATKQSVLQRVIDSHGLHTTPEQLAKQVSADAAANTSVIELTVTASSPQEAAGIANSWSSALQSVVRSQLAPTRFNASTNSATPAVRVVPVQQASAPSSPSSPNLPLNLLIGGLIGLILGALATALREALDTRLRGEREVQLVTQRPILGSIHHDPAATKRPILPLEGSSGGRAEAYRALRTNLQFVDFEQGQRTMVVTSSIEREGKTTSAVNLALTLADAETSVLVVDADLRRPKVAEYLGLDGGVGLTDVLVGRASLESAIQRIGAKSLSILPAGQIPPNPSELLQSRSMVELIRQLGEHFDVVIFDAPPLLPVTDAAILSRRTNGALVVAASKRVTRQQFRAALNSLEQVDAKILGIVLTMVPRKGPDAYGYGRGEYASVPSTSGGSRHTTVEQRGSVEVGAAGTRA